LFEKLNEAGIEVDFDVLKGKKEKKEPEQKATPKDKFRKFKLDMEFDTGLPEG